MQNLLVPHGAIASTEWLLLVRPSIPPGAVPLFCQEPARAWGLSGQHLSSEETTRVENGSYCLAACTYKQTRVPNTGLVSQRGEAGFTPSSWVSPMLPASALPRCFYCARVSHQHIYWHKSWAHGESTGRFLGIPQERGWKSKTSSPVYKGLCPVSWEADGEKILSGNEPDENYYQQTSRGKP